MTVTDLPTGYYMVPPGKLANAVTWLEIRKCPAEPLAHPLRLIAAMAEDRAACRQLFAEIGTPWLWTRAFEADDRLPRNTFFAEDEGERRVGIVEFAAADASGVEIAYFGLRPAATGGGLGRRMMAAALDLAWQTSNRVWLHTCSFDHPAALRFYQSCGFVPYASGFEIMDDPRLDGRLSRGAAPHVALIAPG